MKDEDKSREQLISELVELRRDMQKLKNLDEDIKGSKNMIYAATSYETYGPSTMNLNERLLENSSDIIVITDKDGTIINIYPSIERLYGIKNEIAIGANIFDYINTDDISEVANAINSMIEFPNIPKSIEVRSINLPTGSRHFEVTGTNMFGESGIDGIVFNSRDITEKKKAEKELMHEKEKLIVTLKNIGEAVITVDCDERILLMNNTAEIFTGWSIRKALSKPLKEVLHLVDRTTKELFPDPLSKILEDSNNSGVYNQIVMLSRSGRERIICGNVSKIVGKDENITGTVLVIKDITEKIRFDEESCKATKIESLGILAGGIAHDFNNILTIILGNISLAKIKVFKDSREKIYERLTEIEKASFNAKNLTQQLLTFAKGGEPIIKTVSITRLLKDSVAFALRGSDIRCNFNISKDLWSAEIDEGQINQVINNLVINAKQAMFGGGTLTISAENINTRKCDDMLQLKLGEYVKISIKDKGSGIAEEDLPKIFDPYFTTKSSGNGFGLTTSYSIIKKHGGCITVESTLGKGTTFFIYLPASINVRAQPPDMDPNIIHGSGRILIVDDDYDVRSIAGKMLNEIGYEVQFAKNGFEAIELYKEGKITGNTFKVVIMDLTIPGGMGGKEAIKWLHEIDPEIKAIVSSGYSNDPVMANYSAYGFKGVVAKPYKINEIGETLNSVILGV